MGSYGVEQWQYLLDAGDGVVTVFLVVRRVFDGTNSVALEEEEEGNDCSETEHEKRTVSDDGSSGDPGGLMNNSMTISVLGCVLRIGYGAKHTGYGMMLVHPEARGLGLARRLLEAAMMNQQGSVQILGTCTEMGRPFYEKIGYRRVGTVTRRTVRFQRSSSTSGVTNGNLTSIHDVQATPDPDPKLWKKFVVLDTQACGIDRSETLRAIHNYPYVSTATILLVKTIDDKKDTISNTKDDGMLGIGALVTHHTNTHCGTGSFTPAIVGWDW